MEERHHVLLVCGWFSSIFWFFRTWARKIEKRLKRKYGRRVGRDIIVHVVSSDGKGERAAQKAIMKDAKDGRLGKVFVCGHSNGGRDGPCLTSRLFYPDIIIDYAAVIDMTLAEWGEELYGNVLVCHEFWAKLERVDLHESFLDLNGEYKFFDLNKILKRRVGHVEAASVEFTQDTIFDEITKRIDEDEL